MSSGLYEVDSEIIVSRNNDGSIVAMKVDDSDLFYKITGVATTVWTHIEEGLSKEDILDKVASEYDVTKEVVSKDFDSFIKELKKFDIIKEK